MEKEIVHQTPPFSRLFSSAIFDALTLILLSFLLFSLSLPLYQRTSVYQGNSSFREEIMLSSHLYVAYDGGVQTLSSSLDGDASFTFEEKGEKVRAALDYCYNVYLNEDFEFKGQERLLSFLSPYSNSGAEMFDSNGERTLVSHDYDEAYFACYKEILESKAVVDLGKKMGFSDARRNILIGYGVSFLLSFSLSCVLLLYLVPICFHRGKKTFGMALTRIGYVDLTGISPKPLRFTLRFLFLWILILLGGFFTFGLTWAISACFAVFRKDRQTISDYVMATYLVDDSNKKIIEAYKESQ